MKKFLSLFAILLFIGYSINAQVVFSDDFESGTANWTLTGDWGTTTSQLYTGANSLTDSPSGDYLDDVNSSATMATGVDLSSVPSASLSFWAIMDIESGFDYMYVDVSTDDFSTYNTIATFDTDAALTPWVQYTYDLGGYTGNANVKVRFHFVTDQGWTQDGMYIDDLEIVTSTVDSSPPLIIHSALPFFEGSLNDHVVAAEVIDFSGINATELRYDVDGTPQTPVAGIFVSGNTYEYTIPTQTPGAWVEYKIWARDAYATPNEIETDSSEYIAGDYISYDNGVIDFYGQIGPGAPAGSPLQVAVRVAIGNADLVAILIRNYTDNSHPNDDMEIHIWDDNGGVPGNDVITPFTITPEATLTNTSAMTRVDLRSYSAQLSALTGNYYIGYNVPSGITNLTMTQPGSAIRSFDFDGTSWIAAEGQNGSSDYHFRAITTENTDIEGPNIANNTIPIYYEGTFGDMDVSADITDMTGVASSTLSYKVDDILQADISGLYVSGNEYTFTIPTQTPGAMVKYWISATDIVTPTPYVSETDTFRYIAGNYLAFDNSNPNYYTAVGASGYPAVAVKMTFNGTTNIVSALIRNYYDSGAPNADIEVHVLADNAGVPGADLITPFIVIPAASATDLTAWTTIDLRPFSAQLSGISMEVYIGFSTPSGDANALYDTTGTVLNSFYFDGSGWLENTTDNFHIRAVCGDITTSIDTKKVLSNDYNLFPNPSNGEFTVYVNDLSQDITVQVYSLVGEIILEDKLYSNFSTFDISNLSKGIYIVKVNDIKKKLIVQ